MGWHLIIDNDSVSLPIAEEVEGIRSVFISFLRFDDLLHQGGLCILSAEQVEDTGEITQLNVELDEASNIDLSLLHINSGVHPLKIE